MSETVQEMAQNTKDQLRDAFRKMISDGSLSDFLKKDMKAVIE